MLKNTSLITKYTCLALHLIVLLKQPAVTVHIFLHENLPPTLYKNRMFLEQFGKNEIFIQKQTYFEEVCKILRFKILYFCRQNVCVACGWPELHPILQYCRPMRKGSPQATPPGIARVQFLQV